MRCKVVKEYYGLNVHMEIYEPINIKKAFKNILKYSILFSTFFYYLKNSLIIKK